MIDNLVEGLRVFVYCLAGMKAGDWISARPWNGWQWVDSLQLRLAARRRRRNARRQRPSGPPPPVHQNCRCVAHPARQGTEEQPWAEPMPETPMPDGPQ